MKCKFPECFNDGSRSWANLNLCIIHHETIKVETEKFYHGTCNLPESIQRQHYHKIDLQIPHSKRNLRLKRGEKI